MIHLVLEGARQQPAAFVNLLAALAIERSDVCAVPAAAVVGEAVVCLVLADAVLERFGGDSMRQVLAHVADATGHTRRRLSRSAARPTAPATS